MRHSHRNLHWIAIVLAAFLVVSSAARADDLQQHLHDQYQGRALLLRGSYSGNHLHYDSAGTVDKATAGDWTSDGVVLINEVRISNHRLTIKASRVLVAAQGELRFLESRNHRPKKWDSLKIEAELGQSEPTVAEVDAAISRIFATSHDNFIDLVPDYWKPCLQAALAGGKLNCRFSKEVLSIPGVQSSGKLGEETSAPTEKLSDHRDSTAFRIGQGVSPPRLIYQYEPAFNEIAREVKYQGTLTLGLIVNREGVPTDIHILSPLGCGLDLKAVQAVKDWRFSPAEKDGQPVAVEIAVEVAFHLY